jgi:hypothetical protein
MCQQFIPIYRLIGLFAIFVISMFITILISRKVLPDLHTQWKNGSHEMLIIMSIPATFVVFLVNLWLNCF